MSSKKASDLVLGNFTVYLPTSQNSIVLEASTSNPSTASPNSKDSPSRILLERSQAVELAAALIAALGCLKDPPAIPAIVVSTPMRQDLVH